MVKEEQHINQKGLGSLVRLERKRKNMSQATLAKLFGKSSSTISKIECNKREVTNAEIEKILDILEISKETYATYLNSSKKNVSQKSPSNGSKLSKQQLISIIKKYFQNQPVKEAYLFGSVARGEHHSESDIDIMIAFKDDYKATLFDLITFKNELSKLTASSVYIVQKKTAYPHIMESFEQDKIAVYD